MRETTAGYLNASRESNPPGCLITGGAFNV